MKKIFTLRNIVIALAVIVPVGIMVGYSVNSYFSESCITCKATPTPVHTTAHPTSTATSTFVNPTSGPTSTSHPTYVAPAGTYVPVPAPSNMQDLGYCTIGCGELLIGNNICDPMCNNQYCDYDGGDCD